MYCIILGKENLMEFYGIRYYLIKKGKQYPILMDSFSVTKTHNSSGAVLQVKPFSLLVLVTGLIRNLTETVSESE